MILRYSKLNVALSEEEQKKKALKAFASRVEKRRAKGEQVVFDPNIVNVDIDGCRIRISKEIGINGRFDAWSANVDWENSKRA